VLKHVSTLTVIHALFVTFWRGVFICIGLSASLCVWGNYQKINSKKGQIDWAVIPTQRAKKNKTITIIGVGDIMLGTNFPNESYLPPNDGKGLLSEAIDPIRRADIAFGNCEGTFLNDGGNVKKCDDPSLCYAFRQPTAYAQLLREAGFDLVSLANNHSGDFGQTGRESSMKALGGAGLGYAGLKDCPTSIVEKDGVKYGLIAFSPNNGTLNIHNLDSAQLLVRDLQTKVDIVIVSFHGGAEGESHRRVPKKSEYYYDENRGDVYAFAHAVVDAGADVVFGQGPHVARGIELYQGRIIAYSLGNFCTYSRFSLKGCAGTAPMLEVEVNKDGEFKDGRIISFVQVGEGGPIHDANKRAVKEIKELTELDFPETDLIIKENGRILKKPRN
jgi:poly-gamma-glutamate capsule biosynthesis protein CapA/YwtB (metallophosphatase superfamily)